MSKAKGRQSAQAAGSGVPSQSRLLDAVSSAVRPVVMSADVLVALHGLSIGRAALALLGNFQRHWCEGADLLLNVADAAHALALELERAKQFAHRGFESQRVLDLDEAFRDQQRCLYRWAISKGRQPDRAPDDWLVAFVENGTASGRQLAFPSLRPAKEVATDPAGLRAYAGDLRAVADAITEKFPRVEHTDVHRRSSGRPRKRPEIGTLAGLARKRRYSSVEVARVASHLGLAIDPMELEDAGAPRPPRPQPDLIEAAIELLKKASPDGLTTEHLIAELRSRVKLRIRNQSFREEGIPKLLGSGRVERRGRRLHYKAAPSSPK